MQERVYPQPRPETTANPSVIEAAKEHVPTVDLADRLCGPGQLKRMGERWVARCPLPGHDEKTASFTVYPASDGFYCFGCLRGGDVVTLAQIAWEIDNAATVAAEVLLVFGRGDAIPPRPDSWFRRQERQKPVRDGIEAAKMRLARERLYRRFFAPLVESIEDPAVRASDEQALWEATEPLARHLIANMMGGDR
jgi:DNA primase